MFLHIRPLLLALLPSPDAMYHFFGKSYTRRRALYTLYCGWYRQLKKKVVAYHKDELVRLDFQFAMEEGSKELVRRRNAARDAGIGPVDSEYPDIEDVMGDRLEEVWGNIRSKLG